MHRDFFEEEEGHGGKFDAMSTFQKTTDDLGNFPRSKHVNSHFMGHYSHEDQQNKVGMVLLLS